MGSTAPAFAPGVPTKLQLLLSSQLRHFSKMEGLMVDNFVIPFRELTYPLPRHFCWFSFYQAGTQYTVLLSRRVSLRLSFNIVQGKHPTISESSPHSHRSVKYHIFKRNEGLLSFISFGKHLTSPWHQTPSIYSNTVMSTPRGPTPWSRHYFLAWLKAVSSQTKINKDQ